VIAMPVLDLPAETAAAAPPAIISPGPRQASFGRLTIRLAPRTERVVVVVDGVSVLERRVTTTLVRLAVPLPQRNVSIRVVAYDAGGASGSDVVRRVFGLPRAALPHATVGRLDSRLQRRLRRLARGFPGITGFYVMNLRTGIGAAWNAKARFPAASTVKLAIAIEVMRQLRGIPGPGTRLRRLLRASLVHSSNRAANELLEWLGGTQSGGASQVTSTLRHVGLYDTYLYAGFVLGTAYTGGKPIPLNVVAQPSFTGKYTSAWDLARLHRYVHLATAGRGQLIKRLRGFSSADARSLLYLLCHSADHGKLDRLVRGPKVAVPHKAGWISTARHDAGIVYWSGGGFVASVLTWNSYGVTRRADVLAGRMAKTALDRFKALKAPRSGFARGRIAFA
jgi:hypothetical protein